MRHPTPTYHALRSISCGWFSGLSDSTDFRSHLASHISSFDPSDIYDSRPAPSTINQFPSPKNSSSNPQPIEQSPSPFLSESHQILHIPFVEAVQERLINDICSVQDHDRILCRLNDGFLSISAARFGYRRGASCTEQVRAIVSRVFF